MTTGEYNAKLVEVARSYLGQRETGRNSGPMIDAWLNGVDLSPGHPWCAAFAHGVAFEAASSLGIPCPCPRTGGSLRLWELAARMRQSTPAPGSLYVVSHGHGLGHVGIIEIVSPSGTVTEISGNTDGAGSREGDQVARHAWDWRHGRAHGGELLGFIDLELAIDVPGAA